MTKSKSMTDKK